MDLKLNKAPLDASESLGYWKDIPIEDIAPLRLHQRIDQSIGGLVELLEQIHQAENDATNLYLSFVWSSTVRDFTILLRDSLLASVKEEQLRKDDRNIQESIAQKIQTVIQNAATEVWTEISTSGDKKHDTKAWQHQESPITEVIKQLKELQKQCKKIHRSGVKIDDIRTNIGDYVKDFHIQYSKQSKAVKELFDIVDEVKSLIAGITSESSETMINNVVDEIGENSLKLEKVQGTDSIEILPYENKETLNIPISTTGGVLNFKSINIKSEFARWFSSFIYPQIVELESKRDHAVEKCLLAFSQIRTKIAAISLADIDDTVGLQKDFGTIFSQLDKEVLESLKEEEEETNALVSLHESKFLVASNVYSNETLFLPESGTSQISNMSRDAQKRLLSYFDKYKRDLKHYINRVLSRYVEMDKTSYSQYIKNQMTIYEEDDSLALFMKNGYLGKSFTVPRPELMNVILDEYNLWMDGFAGAVLVSGVTGRGKSTLLGMINQIGLNEEIILLKTGESYFIRHRSYDANYNLKELLDHVRDQSRGEKIVVCIDDLELWHDDEYGLYDNITKLFEAMVRYRSKMFFVVTCSPFLKERIKLLKDLKAVFSSQIELGKMNSGQIKNALDLRARVKDVASIPGVDMEARFRNIIRDSRGNIGQAMMEYCRLYNENYKPNLKSQEFKEVIRMHQTLLLFISSYQMTSLSILLESLSEIDYTETLRSIDHLVGQKILIRPKKGYISINPLLIHTIERTLSKLRK